jgi:hypothetical protein
MRAPSTIASSFAPKNISGLLRQEVAVHYARGAPSSDLLRIKGEMVLLQDAPNAADAAQGHFEQCLEWARRQGALSWELRGATSLARLWHRERRTSQARKLLAPVYHRFTEGLGSADLITSLAPPCRRATGRERTGPLSDRNPAFRDPWRRLRVVR